MNDQPKTAFIGLDVMGGPMARRLGLAAPVTALVDQFYADVQAAGGRRKDTSALITRLPRHIPTEG